MGGLKRQRKMPGRTARLLQSISNKRQLVASTPLCRVVDLRGWPRGAYVGLSCRAGRRKECSAEQHVYIIISNYIYTDNTMLYAFLQLRAATGCDDEGNI